MSIRPTAPIEFYDDLEPLLKAEYDRQAKRHAPRIRLADKVLHGQLGPSGGFPRTGDELLHGGCEAQARNGHACFDTALPACMWCPACRATHPPRDLLSISPETEEVHA